VSVPGPPFPFDAIEEPVLAGSPLYRIHTDRFGAAEFNPGLGAATRFAFFGDPVVPILYAGDTEDTAFCEAILRETAVGGYLPEAGYRGRRCSRISPRRDLRLASLVGFGPRALGVEAELVCATDANDYPLTVRWAEAAHEAGFDGLAYPSRFASGRRATVYFGDRVSGSDFEVDSGYSWFFDEEAGFAKMGRICASVDVTLLSI
jgi:hypothetical protein